MRFEELVENEIAIGLSVTATYKDKSVTMNAWDWMHSEHKWLKLKVGRKTRNDQFEYFVQLEK